MENLSKYISVVTLGTASSTGVGTTLISDLPCIDMAGYDGVLFIGVPKGAGVAGAVLTLKAKYGDSSTGVGDTSLGSSTSVTASTASVAGSTSTAASTGSTGPVVLLDIYKPPHRFVSVDVYRATQNVDCQVLALRYAGLKTPITQSTLYVYDSKVFVTT